METEVRARQPRAARRGGTTIRPAKRRRRPAPARRTLLEHILVRGALGHAQDLVVLPRKRAKIQRGIRSAQHRAGWGQPPGAQAAAAAGGRQRPSWGPGGLPASSQTHVLAHGAGHALRRRSERRAQGRKRPEEGGQAGPLRRRCRPLQVGTNGRSQVLPPARARRPPKHEGTGEALEATERSPEALCACLMVSRACLNVSDVVQEEFGPPGRGLQVEASCCVLSFDWHSMPGRLQLRPAPSLRSTRPHRRSDPRPAHSLRQLLGPPGVRSHRAPRA